MKSQKTRSQTSAKKSGAQPQNSPELELFVLSRNNPSRPEYRRARLRYKRRGNHTYVYIHWRDGDTFGDYYVGKIASKCPTASAPGDPPARLLQRRRQDKRRGAKSSMG